MNLEKQVSNKKLSQRLRELGVKKESLFVWFKPQGGKWEIGLFDGTFFHGEKEKDTGHYGYRFGLSKNNYAAFTVAELVENIMLAGDENVKAITYKTGEQFGMTGDGVEFLRNMYNPDNLAKMLIYLLENKLLTV